MAATMQVELVSPEKVLFSGEATMVITRTLGGGDVAFLPGHAPFLAALVECHTKIHLVDGKIQDVAVHGGFVQVDGHKVSILSDVAELSAQIDVARAKSAKDRAEDAARHGQDAGDSSAALRRSKARLEAAAGGH